MAAGSAFISHCGIKSAFYLRNSAKKLVQTEIIITPLDLITLSCWVFHYVPTPIMHPCHNAFSIWWCWWWWREGEGVGVAAALKCNPLLQ